MHWCRPPFAGVVLVVCAFLPQPAADDDQPSDAVKTTALQNGELTGNVVGPDGEPVKDVVVQAIYAGLDSGNRSAKATTDATGSFRLERKRKPLLLVASSADRTLTGRVLVGSEKDSARLKLAPAAMITGCLIEDETPIAKKEVKCYLPLRTTGPDDRGGALRFMIASIATAPDGRFAFSGLFAGDQYQLFVGGVGPARATIVKTGTIVSQPLVLPAVDLKNPGTTDLGYTALPLPRRMSVTPQGVRAEIDFSELAVRRTCVGADVAARISTALADAQREDRRVMLVLGDPGSRGMQSLLRRLDGIDGADNTAEVQRKWLALQSGNPITTDDLARLVADFQRVPIHAGDEAAATRLAKAHRLDVSKLALPVIAILAEDGSVDEHRSFPADGDPPAVDNDALGEFLKRHAPASRDAEELIRAAARRAANENKRVLLQHSGPGSYPSRLLTRFIEERRDLFDRDYVYVNLDAYRSINGSQVIKKFRESDGALPWIAILDGDGTKLADSDGPSGNIGFPVEPDAINYFIDKLLKPTVRRLTGEQLEDLRSALGAK